MLIDLNADLGEGAGTDAELMPLVTSANVGCGLHAGDVDTVCAALELAERFGVRVGAHPGYADRVNLGRVEMELDEGELFHLGVFQVGALKALAEVFGVEVSYLKPHGALYHQAARQDPFATGLLAVASHFDRLPLVGPPGSYLQKLAEKSGVPFVPEGYADRRYRPDGTLVPRTEPDALLTDPKEAVEQVERLIRERGVRTICIHGDTPGAIEFACTVRAALLDRGHELKAFA